MEQWQKVSKNCVSVLNNLSCYWAIYHLSWYVQFYTHSTFKYILVMLVIVLVFCHSFQLEYLKPDLWLCIQCTGSRFHSGWRAWVSTSELVSALPPWMTPHGQRCWKQDWNAELAELIHVIRKNAHSALALAFLASLISLNTFFSHWDLILVIISTASTEPFCFI